jgi:hypothetical protein
MATQICAKMKVAAQDQKCSASQELMRLRSRKTAENSSLKHRILDMFSNSPANPAQFVHSAQSVQNELFFRAVRFWHFLFPKLNAQN